MGLPEISIEFKGKATSAMKRSAMGIVALVLRDTTNLALNSSLEYLSIDEVNVADFSPDNLDYIEKTFLGSPSKVIIEILGTEDEITFGTERLKSKKWNYLAFPDATASDSTELSTFIIDQRDNAKKTYKAVLADTAADHEGVINFTTDEIKVGEKVYTTSQYTPRIAGILAGLPFTRSSTYFVLDEVESIKEHVDPDAAIDSGELILVNDGEKIKIGRGVNSLITLPEPELYATTVSKTEDFKKIKILEVMDMVKDDIRDTFNQNYVGKVPNTYDNQVLFFTFVNSYFDSLAGEDVLDSKFENKAELNVEAQRAAWESVGVNTSGLNDQQIKEKSFKSNVFAGGQIKIVDAMEDLDFQIVI